MAFSKSCHVSRMTPPHGVRNDVGKGENHISERVVIIGHCFKRENNYLSIPIHCPWPLAASALVLWFNQANWANRRVKGQCWWMMSKNSLDFIQLLFWLFLFESSIIFLSFSHHIGQVHSFFQTSQHLSLQLWLVQGLQLLPYRKCIINSVVKHLDGKTCFDMGDLKMTPFIVKWNPNILRHIRLLNKYAENSCCFLHRFSTLQHKRIMLTFKTRPPNNLFHLCNLYNHQASSQSSRKHQSLQPIAMTSSTVFIASINAAWIE